MTATREDPTTTSQSADDPTLPVLIVGGGPVGLVAACELLRRGIDVRVIDRSRKPTAQSKAIIVWPRTLELLSGLGIAEQMVDAGHVIDGVKFYSSGSAIGTVNVTVLEDCRFNHMLMLAQWETERIVLARFLELGGSVEWGTELTELHPTENGFEAVLRTADGQTVRAATNWLIGADGAHSLVRRELNVGFDLHTPNMTFAIADVPIAGGVQEDHLHYFYSANGALGVGPLGGGVFRLAVNVPPGTTASTELFQSALDARAGRIGTVGTPLWTALFDVRCATAETFGTSRAFLVGDAAHVVSPAGGQGLNTGIHDAVNLGWKLAGVISGDFDERLLGTYDSERRPAVARISAITDRQTRWGLLVGRRQVLVRDFLVRLVSRSGLLASVVAPMLSQTDLSYGTELPGWKPRRWRYPRVSVGGRLPYLAHRCGSGSDGMTLPLLVTSRGTTASTAWASTLERLGAAAPTSLAVLDLVGRPGSAEAKLAALLGDEPTALLVRPDGHILSVGSANSPELVFEPLRQILAVQAGSRPSRGLNR